MNRTGDGRWRRRAASFSPGDSNATTGAPKVTPMREAKVPPRLCPTCEIGLQMMCQHEYTRTLTSDPYIGIRIHVN